MTSVRRSRAPRTAESSLGSLCNSSFRSRPFLEAAARTSAWGFVSRSRARRKVFISDWVARTPFKSGALKREVVKRIIIENCANSKKSRREGMRRREGKPSFGLPDLEGPASRDCCSNPVSRAGHLTPIRRPCPAEDKLALEAVQFAVELAAGERQC